MQNPNISIVILTYNRPDSIIRNVREILDISIEEVELIVVDNCSDVPVTEILSGFDGVRIIRLEENVGVAGRNIGVSEANADIVITLDDDVFGLTDRDIRKILRLFNKRNKLGAINFKVIDDETEEQINWCHHRKIEDWCDVTFSTYEISEGAVAFKRLAFTKAGAYPDYFFISHEGPDLAIRMMNIDYDILYVPDIVVRHAHAPEGRPSWRRYYYDSRNIIWLAARCYPIQLTLKRLFIDLSALFVYAVRDGFVTYWAKGIKDGFLGTPKVYKDRVIMSKQTIKRYRALEKYNPSFMYMFRKRVFRKNVNI
ncbi:hypothetical protein DIT71_09285 [Marinobacter vulgaris]|uniref:Glycosyltransferase 2-like domain-containing protein n=1 Tax=Marinobacter vulgaris TaxID=1928331 RepID=A0A2V3ZJY9_9GAMM|nr:glycosyltransferase [Marinobacter vulgaris]PXX90730.1 hypothetical protein DIT71_09285 [Marinobacter vulgaris]TSJ70296.1 glycosyltransferase family 2 protein [Marinobacter vulgaris]